MKKVDFTGQHIYVGMDIGKKSWKVCMLTEELEHGLISQPPRVEVLVNYLRRSFPGAKYHCTYEAGYSGYWIYEELKKEGIECLIVNPADVPTTHKEKTRKTDRIDARKLARSLRNGELTGIYVPEHSTLEDRSLVRTRHSLVKKQTRCKNQIKGLLNFYGVNIPEELVNSHWSRRYIGWLEQLIIGRPSVTHAVRTLLEELKYLRQMIAEMTKEIRLMSREEEYKSDAHYLMTVPGISTLSAMIFLTELGKIDRFERLDKLASYVGLVPGEQSSGEREVITGITCRRNPYLRGLIIESAWVAAKKDPAMIMSFNQLCKRMPRNQAIVRIARKLLNRIRYVLIHQEPYVPAVVS
jgi:transposase